MKKIDKCVKVVSYKLDENIIKEIKKCITKYVHCKNDFYQQYGTVKCIEMINNPYNLRNRIRKENYELDKKYQFQNRYWIMALFDVCSNLKSCWSNLANELKIIIKANENLTEDEHKYLFYILSCQTLWSQILNDEELYIKNMKNFNELKGKVQKDRIHYLHNYLKRITRRNKFNTPYSESYRCINLEECMYSITEENGKTYISFMSDIKRKPFKIELKSPYCYNKKGNIQLILNEEKKRIEIHKVIKARTKENKSTQNIGIDKGYTTLLSCSDGKEYGQGMGELFTQTSDFTNKRNTNRNFFFVQKRQLEQNICFLVKLLKITNNKEDKAIILSKLKECEQKLKHIEEHHIGNKNYNKQQERKTATLEKETNHAIKQMFKESDVKSFAKEDLSFTKTSNKGSKLNRLLNSWIKGTLDERLEYLASYYNISFVDVNPAYTSQYCNTCNSKITRSGKHNEIANCPKCGKMNANINAAKNILSRMFDTRITLYTPYKLVEQILYPTNTTD